MSLVPPSGSSPHNLVSSVCSCHAIALPGVHCLLRSMDRNGKSACRPQVSRYKHKSSTKARCCLNRIVCLSHKQTAFSVEARAWQAQPSVVAGSAAAIRPGASINLVVVVVVGVVAVGVAAGEAWKQAGKYQRRNITRLGS